jgi:hypothetical protein
MTTTYQKLLNKIEAFCNAHLQIKKYKGEFKEQMPNFATLDEKYPIVFVVPNGDTEGLELNQFTLEVYCLDIIQKDRANINTIVSDCHLILKDLYLYFKDGTDLEVDVIGDPTMTPLNNDLLDYAAGWVMTITFEVEGYTVCAIPMNPIPPFTPICQDATVENSDESYTVTVASGGTLVLPDITVTDSDGSTFTQPAVQDVTCTPALDADYQITDTDDNILYSGTIPSGGSLDQTISDSTYLVEYENGTPIENGSILAEGSAVIQVPNPIVCEDATYTITDTDLNTLYTGSIPSGGDLQQPIQDSTATLKDTADNVLSTTQILAEGSEDIVAPDATYTVEYLNGTPIQSGSILSGGFELIQVPNPITCADAVVNVNSVFFDNVASGGTLNIQVRKSSGSNLVGSKQGQHWRIGDSTAVLKTSGGATISTTSIRAEESEDITAPDATVENSNATYTDSVVSGGTLVLPDITVTDSDGSTYTQPSVENVVCTLSPDSDLEVNGSPEGTFAAGSTIEVNITDGVNPVTPDAVTVVGDVVTIEVPAATPAPVGATLMKTGQTTSYRTGDDGDLEAGRATDFFTLASKFTFPIWVISNSTILLTSPLPLKAFEIE